MGGGKIALVSLAQALGTVLYVALVVLLLQVWEQQLRARQDAGVGPPYWGMLGFLLLFVISACIAGSLVLGYPAVLALRQRVRDAILLVGATVGWLVLLLFGLLALVGLQVIRLS